MAARDWNLWPAAAGAGQTPAPAAQDTLRRFAVTLDKIHFPALPRLNLDLTADGRDPDTLRPDIGLPIRRRPNPLGRGTGLKLDAQCVRPMIPAPRRS